MRGTRTILLLILLGLALGPPARAHAQTGQTPVTGQPSISLQKVQEILAHSPLLPMAEDIYRLGQQANIDPAFALAIWTHESSLDTAGVSVQHNNPGNLTCAAAQVPPAVGCSAAGRSTATSSAPWPTGTATSTSST